MKTVYLSYVDTPATPTERGSGWKLEGFQEPGELLIVKEGVLPGAFGYPDLHIRRLQGLTSVNGRTHPLVITVTTERAVTAQELGEFLKQGRAFAKESLNEAQP